MADPIKVFYIKQGDRLPELKGQFLDGSNNPVDLTGAALEMHMYDPDTDTLKVNAAAAIDGTPTLGRFKYAWAVNDTDKSGRFPFEVEATFSGNRQLTGPNKMNGTIVIAPQLG